MPKYKLTNKAVSDLSDIWNFTFENWNEKQADKYYKTILKEFRAIAQDPEKGRSYEKLLLNLRGSNINKHIIFYRILEHGIVEIERILHEGMDLKRHFGK